MNFGPLFEPQAALARQQAGGGGGAVIDGRAYPAPIGGWNAKDPLQAMNPADAVILDNWFPETAYVRLRRGHSSYATGIGTGAVETLITYASGASSKMLACGNSAIYDVSSSGAVGVAKASGLTNTRYQWVNFKGYVIAVNGADEAKKYDGSTVSHTAVSGSGLSSDADLIHVNDFKSMLFFIEKTSMNAWYLAANAITGTATKLDMSTFCKLGGYLMAMGTWTRDGGDGPDDLAVWITSRGEVIVFQGTDPSDATKWALVGVFKVGAPVGRRCMEKVGAELVVITLDGFIPLSRVLPWNESAPKLALSDRISNAVGAATRMFSGNFGWQGILYPKGNMGIFNVPVTANTTAHQYVMNTITQAWCRFTGMNANCWAVFNEALYFGGPAGAVYLADDGTADNGGTISADAKQAFSYFGTTGRNKDFKMVRPVFASEGDVFPAIEINTDFRDNVPSASPTVVGSSGSPWDTTDWDIGAWGDEALVAEAWITVSGQGRCASIRNRVVSDSVQIFWLATDWIYEIGATL